jgi:hypothetical protein
VEQTTHGAQFLSAGKGDPNAHTAQRPGICISGSTYEGCIVGRGILGGYPSGKNCDSETWDRTACPLIGAMASRYRIQRIRDISTCRIGASELHATRTAAHPPPLQRKPSRCPLPAGPNSSFGGRPRATSLAACILLLTRAPPVFIVVFCCVLLLVSHFNNTPFFLRFLSTTRL